MAQDFSVQLYSVRTVLQQDPLSTLSQIKRMGYTGVEGFGPFNYSSSDVNYAMSDSGLKLVGWHTPWAAVQDDKITSTIQFFKTTGVKYVVIPSLPEECRNSIDAWKRTAERFNEISKRLQAEGLVLGYHNHSVEFTMMDGQLPFTVFFDSTDPAIVVQMDNGNALSGGGDVMAVMRRYPGRARSVHLKPYSKERGSAPIIGEDDNDWAAFMQWCRESGGTEHYIVEYENDQAHPQMEGVDLCLKALREMEKSGRI